MICVVPSSLFIRKNLGHVHQEMGPGVCGSGAGEMVFLLLFPGRDHLWPPGSFLVAGSRLQFVPGSGQSLLPLSPAWGEAGSPAPLSLSPGWSWEAGHSCSTLFRCTASCALSVPARVGSEGPREGRGLPWSRLSSLNNHSGIWFSAPLGSACPPPRGIHPLLWLHGIDAYECQPNLQSVSLLTSIPETPL